MHKHKIKNYLFPVITFIVGILLATTIQLIYAHGGDTSLIHSCIKNNNGTIRIVRANDTCGNGETALDWSIQGPPGPQGPPGVSGYFGLPFICTASCELNRFADKFAGKDFSNAQIYSAYFADANLQGVIFKGGNLNSSDFNHSDLTNADLSDLVDFKGGPDGGSSLNFDGANLTNTNISNVLLYTSVFTNAVLQNTNFTNCNLERVNFTGATMMSTANITGVTWSNTTCPDGTNSDNNGNTCLGHF